LVATTPVRLLEIGEAEYKKLADVDPTYSPTVIPADTYKGVSSDVKTVASPVHMYTTEDMSDELAYKITKAFWENRKLIADAHATGKGLDIAGVRYGGAKVHPGAQRYYKEKGIEIPASMR
jgi:TRAP transporter TAXI family solute receptor